jgi:peptidoglycan/xylan/chitin deacetylase (PgdA/CDA1 family)
MTASHWAARDAEAGPAKMADRLRGEAIVLMYHHVAEPPPGAPVRGLYVTPAQFAWQLEWLLGQGARFVTCRDLLADPQPERQPRIVVTFDDGHRDVYEQGLPILRRLGVPAVVFPVVGDLGKTAVVWPESEDRSPMRLLTDDQVREMAAAGIEFGSHLWDHVHADRLGRDALRKQLERSHVRLAELLGAPPVTLAYPYGAHNDTVVEEAARAGYRIAVTTEQGRNSGRPLLRLRRVAVKGTRWHHCWRFTRGMKRLLAVARQASPETEH